MPTVVDGNLQPTSGSPEYHPADTCSPDYCDPDCVNCPESVGWDLSFGSRINFGPATATADAPLTVHLSLSDDAIARSTVLREITRAQLLTFARHLMTLAKGPGDIEESVAKLNETIALLDERIYARADEIAAERVEAATRPLRHAAKDAERQLIAERQRREDLTAEFRRQIAALERNSERYQQMLAEAGVDWHTGFSLRRPTTEAGA